jgi:hypothetical protein
MHTSPIQWYALAVCFAALMCFMVALGVVAFDVVEFTNPELTNSQLTAYATRERFVHLYPDKRDLAPPQQEVARLFERALYVESIQHAARQSLIFTGIILVIDVVVFALH